MPVGVKQHLVSLQKRGTNQKRPAVRQLDMGDLQLCPLAAEEGKILTPVELERLPRTKSQRDESAAPRRLLLSLPICSPISGKSRNPTVGPREPEGHKIGMQLLQRPALLARLAGLGLKSARKLLGKRIKLVRAVRNGELRLDRARIQVLLDSIARQPGSACDLSDRQLQAQRHAPDQVQKFHVDHSIAPRGKLPWGKGHMGQFSMEITCTSGSLLGANQQAGTDERFSRLAAVAMPHPGQTASCPVRPRWPDRRTRPEAATPHHLEVCPVAAFD